MSIYPPQTTTQGSIFNPDLWVAGDTTTIDTDYLNANYLKYSVAQGYETLNGMTNLGNTTLSSDLRLLSTLSDASGDVGTAGQLLSSTGTGTNWITQTATTGTTYASYSSSATLSTAVNPTLLVVFTGSTSGQTLSIPTTYTIGQIIQIKSTASVNVSISFGLGTVILYASSIITSSYTLIPSDVINLIYSGFTWFQFAPSNTFTKIVGANGCIAGQTNYLAIDTSTLPQTLSTTVNTFILIYFTGSTASKVYNIPAFPAANKGQKISLKNGSSVSVSVAFPIGNDLIYYYETTLTSPFIELKTKEVLNICWNGTNWIQTTSTNRIPTLSIQGASSVDGPFTLSGDFNLAASSTSRILLANSSGTGGQYITSNGSLGPTWTSPSFIGTASSDLSMGSYNITTTTGDLDIGSGGLIKLNGSSGTSGQYLVSGGSSSPSWVSSTSVWNGTATSALSMTTYDITTTTGSLNIGTGGFIKLNSSAGTSGQYLSSTGTLTSPVWATLPASTWVGTATSALSMGIYDITTTTGSLNIGTGGFIKLNSSAGTSGQYLSSSGTLTSPVWATLPASTWVGTAASALTMTTYDITTTTGSLNIGTGGFIKLNSSAGTSGQYLSSSGTLTSPVWATLPASTWVGTATSSLNMNSNSITSATSITSASGGITATTGDIKATAGKLIAGTLDAVSDATAGNTALSIGSNVIVGNIVIGSSQTTGDIVIGQSDITGATITVGTANTATTINGTLSSTGTINSTNIQSASSSSGITLFDQNTSGIIYIGTSLSRTQPIIIGCAGQELTNRGTFSSAGLITATGGLTATGLITANGNIKSASVDPITTGGNLDLGTSQLGGALSIGTNKTSGFIAIGNPGNSGHSVIINSPTAFNQGVTLNASNAYGITTSTTTFTAGNTNIGYQSSATGTAIGTITTTSSAACLTIPTLQVGFYIITLSGNITGFSTTVNYAQPTITITGGVSGVNNINKYNVGSTTGTTGFLFTGPVQIISSTNSITLTFAMSPSGTANMSAVPSYSYIRIA